MQTLHPQYLAELFYSAHQLWLNEGQKNQELRSSLDSLTKKIVELGGSISSRSSNDLIRVAYPVISFNEQEIHWSFNPFLTIPELIAQIDNIA